MRALYWLRNDLRLQDHPGLLAAARRNELLLVYLWPRQRPWCNLQGLGAQRARFLCESLLALNAELAPLGQRLLVLEGSPELVIPDLVRDYRIDELHLSHCPGSYEARAVRVLAKKLSIPVRSHPANRLFHVEAIGETFPELPDTFSPFRRTVEKSLQPDMPLDAPDTLPPPPAAEFAPIPGPSERAPLSLPVSGGSTAGRRRLTQFIDSGAIRRYKQTRNTLDPLAGSSTLSPWLANGCLSAREVAAAVAHHEDEHGSNDSTYWMYFELLWREYFHWRADRDGSALFRPSGNGERVHHCTFEPRNFARWCAGDTDFPLVNALMHQLLDSGWMSNRGRQIAASCLVHEYAIDWRYGAAFFEKHLIDYDVASNYGNWQYIAGVGADPRGGRHFDIDKQASEHDPDGLFTSKWDGHRARQPRYVTDAADWPL